MDSIIALFDSIERYVTPLIGGESHSLLSKQENQVLALQNINRLNIHLGKIARSSKDKSGYIHIFQMYVNNLTIGVKNENVPLMKSSLMSGKNILVEIGREESFRSP